MGFFVRRDSTLQGLPLEALKGLRVGIVRGYAYPERLLSGGLIAEEAANDISNLRKLLQRRIDVAVIDYQVMHYLLAHSPLHSEALALEFHSRWLAEHPLRVCFRHDARLQPVLEALKQRVPTLPALRRHQRDYLKQLGSQPQPG